MPSRKVGDLQDSAGIAMLAVLQLDGQKRGYAEALGDGLAD
jgi:hypothetical protein